MNVEQMLAGRRAGFNHSKTMCGASTRSCPRDPSGKCVPGERKCWLPNPCVDAHRA